MVNLMWYGDDMVELDKKHFIFRMVETAGVTTEDEPAGIFMAGLPGAGKTELSRNLIADSGVNLLRIDMDEIAENIPGYEASRADEYRKQATTLLSELFTYAIRHRLSFVMDGTFGSKSAEQNIERCLKRGYVVKIVYAYQDPKLAWEFTLAREMIEHRAIKFDGFVGTYYKILTNIKEIGEKYGDRVTLDIVVKNPDNRVGKWLRNVPPTEIDKSLAIQYNKDKLIRYISG